MPQMYYRAQDGTLIPMGYPGPKGDKGDPGDLTQATADSRYVNVDGDTMTGSLTVRGGSGIKAVVESTSPANNDGAALHLTTPDPQTGQWAQLSFRIGTKNRWIIQRTNSAEAGGNTGSDFAIRRYDDAGQILDDAVTINRANGAVGVSGSMTVKRPSGATAFTVRSVDAETYWTLSSNGQTFDTWEIDGKGRFLIHTNRDKHTMYACDDAGAWNAPGNVVYKLDRPSKRMELGRSTVAADPALTVASKDYVDSKGSFAWLYSSAAVAAATVGGWGAHALLNTLTVGAGQPWLGAVENEGPGPSNLVITQPGTYQITVNYWSDSGGSVTRWFKAMWSLAGAAWSDASGSDAHHFLPGGFAGGGSGKISNTFYVIVPAGGGRIRFHCSPGSAGANNVSWSVERCFITKLS
jgi:hypothetical protein